jgi:peptidoglycan hydrolase-like protein with peptidoglycan-binding domain
MTRKHLWRWSAALLIINVIIGGFAAFNHITSQYQIAKAKSDVDRQSVLGASTSVPIFSPNYIMSDSTFSSTRVFPNEQSVQDYLDRANSPLRNYSEKGHRASYWIFAAARGQSSSKYGIAPNLNPGVLLAYLEKENSLISLSNYDTANDPDNRLRTAMGYGCPDGSNCDQTYFGFSNQVNWAAYQLQLNFNQSSGTGGGTPYRLNNTITTLDEYNVFLSNAATAAQYRYTPHVYWGNYNLWKIITANGWGVDSNTYAKSDIDRVNLANKDIDINVRDFSPVAYNDVLPLLKVDYTLGETNNDVKLVQQFLRQEGYYMNREITGLFGVVTQEALMTYRQDKGIVIGNGPNDQCKSAINQNFNFGDTSDAIKSLQQCLRELGLFNYPSNTGYYGTVTQAAQSSARKALSGDQSSSETPTSSCDSLKSQSWTYGETSSKVRQLQVCMQQAGTFTYASGATGYFGPVTQAALDSWLGKSPTPVAQSSQSNSVSGSSDCSTLKGASWKYGQSGDSVKALQVCMRSAGVFVWPTDTGYFGPVTEEALAKWKGGNLPTYNCSDLKQQVWTAGETSERVRQLQICMQQAGKFNWSYGATGYFGDVTKAALIAWRGYL